MTWRAPSALTRCWLAGPAVAMTWAPRNEPRATSRLPVTPPAPWTRSCSPARLFSASPSLQRLWAWPEDRPADHNANGAVSQRGFFICSDRFKSPLVRADRRLVWRGGFFGQDIVQADRVAL